MDTTTWDKLAVGERVVWTGAEKLPGRIVRTDHDSTGRVRTVFVRWDDDQDQHPPAPAEYDQCGMRDLHQMRS